MKPPFKLGDRVRVKSIPEENNDWISEMQKTVGKSFTVKRIDSCWKEENPIGLDVPGAFGEDDMFWYRPRDLELVDGLQVGDLVEVIGPCGRCYCPREDDPQIFRITEIREENPTTYRVKDSGRPGYPASSLRKVRPAADLEVKVSLDTSDFTEALSKAEDGLWKFGIEQRLAAIEARLDEQQKTIFGIECAIERIDECQEGQQKDDPHKTYPAEDLQIGDWVEVVSKSRLGNPGQIGHVFMITEMDDEKDDLPKGYSTRGERWYAAAGLRKLSSEEITRRLNA